MTINATRNRGSGKNLTEDEIAYIREQFDKGARPADVARALGCSSTTTERWYQRFRGNMPATRTEKRCHDPYELGTTPLCRHGSCMNAGTGNPPYCPDHKPSPAKPRTVLPWAIPPERLRAGR